MKIYKHGLPFSEKLGNNIISLYKRIQLNKASLLIVAGGVGEGKTTLAVEIADYYNSLYGLPLINLDLNYHPQLSMGGTEFIQNLRICYKEGLPCVIYDEAGDFNRRGALTQFNAMLNRVFETFRGFKILVIVCIPSFDVLDEHLFRNNIPRQLVHLENRTINQGNFKAYSLYRMFYLKARMKKLVVKNMAFSLVEPNFYGHFLDLEPERSNALNKISMKGKFNILKKAEIKSEGLISLSEIAVKINRSIIWIRKRNKELNIKPFKTFEHKHYFKEADTLQRYFDYIDGLKK